jgi:hypothetical protein
MNDQLVTVFQGLATGRRNFVTLNSNYNANCKSIKATRIR